MRLTVGCKRSVYLTVAVADPRAEGRGGGDVLSVGRLEARLLLPLLVPLLHLALAHPAWGQKDGVITAHYGSYTEREGRGGEKLHSYFRSENIYRQPC